MAMKLRRAKSLKITTVLKTKSLTRRFTFFIDITLNLRLYMFSLYKFIKNFFCLHKGLNCFSSPFPEFYKLCNVMLALLVMFNHSFLSFTPFINSVSVPEGSLV